MAPALENVVFDLNEGQISNLVETDYGFQIVKLLRKKPPVSKPLAEVRPFIQRELYMRKAEPEMKEFMESLRSQSFVYIGPNYRSEYDVEGL
jgi:parvulin-like peptidyl-prolyl isomerase